MENEEERMVGFMKEASADDPSIAKVEISSSNKSLAEQYEDLSRNQTFEETNLRQNKAYKTTFTSPFRATAYLVGNDTTSHLILTTVLSGEEKTFEEIFQKILSIFQFTN